MKTLLLATKNPGKISEIKEILKDIPFEIKTLNDYSFMEEIEEKGTTFEENAVAKAKTIGKKFSVLTLADDSGLEIDALGGWPGVYSARHTQGSDDDKINTILEKMSKIPKRKRTARYTTVIALYDPVKNTTQIFEGTADGAITGKRMGTNGFGYDPIFWSKDLRKTFGIASKEDKNRVSHRAMALRKWRKLLTVVMI